MVQLRRLSRTSLSNGLLKMNAQVFFAAVLGLCLFFAVFYFAPNELILTRRFEISMLILFEVTCASVLLRVYGPALMRSPLGIRGWRAIFAVHSTAYALTWGMGCAFMIETLRMNPYAISVTTTALAACVVAVSTFAFDFLACALFLSSLLLPLLKASLFSVENGEGLAGACTLSIAFFMYLAYSLHRAEVDRLLDGETIRRQADELKLSNDLFRGTIDSIDEVFLAVGLDGICYGNRSDRAARVLGGEPIGRHVADILSGSGGDEDELRTWFALVGSKRFTFAQLIDLAPSRWDDQANQRTYRIGWFPMRSEGELKSVIMTLTDVTAKLRSEAQARHAEESARLTLSISADPTVFAQFLERAKSTLTRLGVWPGGDLEPVQKELHDLKGFAGVFGFTSFISEASRVENAIKALDEADVETLVRRETGDLGRWLDAWIERETLMLKRLRVFAPRELNVALAHVEDIRRDVADPAERAAFDRLVARLTLPNLARSLTRFEDPVAHVARRLGKVVRLEIDPSCNSIYLTKPDWVPVVDGMIHLMNNAVDHGLESPDERRARGKAEAGVIRIGAEVRDGWLQINVDDDGRGVDLAKLRERYASRAVTGAAAVALVSDYELAQTIFAPGVSTAERATDISGQGVGLFALAEEVRRAGGTLTVETGRLGGAGFVLRLPA